MSAIPRQTVNLCPEGQAISRRRLLQVGSLGLMGVTLPKLLRADEAGHAGGSAQPAAGNPSQPAGKGADACIVIFLNGGPSHLDMWDMKPDAPEGIRGEFK